MNNLLHDKGVTLYPFKIPDKKCTVNYEVLKSALAVDGLSLESASSKDANKNFISLMKNVAKTEKNSKKSKLDINENHQKHQNQVKLKSTNEETSDFVHDVKFYTSQIHPARKEAEEDKPIKRRLAKLKLLCSKVPFERSNDDVDNIYKVLRTFHQIRDQVEDDMLKMLANIIQFESYDEPEIPLFGNKAFYMIISGQIRPLCNPYIRYIGEPSDRFTFVEDNVEYPLLFSGEFFGTLDEINRSIKKEVSNMNDNIINHTNARKDSNGLLDEMGSKFGDANDECDDDDVDYGDYNKSSDLPYLSKLLLMKTGPQTSYDNQCELIFITTSYYRRILEKYNNQKHADKLKLMKSQSVFNVWPQQALIQVANVMKWAHIPANVIIAKQGQISSILGFIKTGSCYVFRDLKVRITLTNGKVEEKMRQVLVGTIESLETFGEVSLLDGMEIKHSIVSKEPLKIIQLQLDDLDSLDEDVRLLLRQSVTAKYYNITQEEVEKIYVEQRAKDEWNNYKESVISEVIVTRGIKPGTGKWGIKADLDDIY